jgi:hypothetical protein
VAPYREDWQPLRREGFGAYAARISGPSRTAINGHMSPERTTLTEKAGTWIGKKVRGKAGERETEGDEPR